MDESLPDDLDGQGVKHVVELNKCKKAQSKKHIGQRGEFKVDVGLLAPSMEKRGLEHN